MAIELGPFMPGDIRPLLRKDQNIELILRTEVSYGFFRVTFVEPTGDIAFDIMNGAGLLAGATSAQFSSNNAPVNQLVEYEGILTQYRLELLDDYQLIIRQPAANAKGQNFIGNFPITPFLPPNLTEFFVSARDAFTFQCINPAALALATCNLRAYGFRYVIKKLKTKPDYYTTVPVMALLQGYDDENIKVS